MARAINSIVSIVTPSYNSGSFLEQAVQSVTCQNYPTLEHLIIDGGSTDTTLDILRHYPAVTWVSEPDNGQAEAINKGFRLARGQIIGWLNADDTYQPGAVAAAMRYLHTHPEVDLVYGNFNFIDGGGKIIHRQVTPAFSLDKLLFAAIIPQTSMFFRRHVLAEIEGVNPQLQYVMDWEFTLRIAQQYRVARVPETWGNFRIVEGTKSVEQPEKFWPEFISVLDRVVQQHPCKFKAADVRKALFMTHLLAGLEFARVGKLKETEAYLNQAFTIAPQPPEHPAVLASGLYRAAVWPWHRAFEPHPQAGQAVENLRDCLGGSPVAEEIKAFLALRGALKLMRQGQVSQSASSLQEARLLLKRKNFFNWRTVRMIFSAVIKP
jgi:hypothetical protein